MKNSTYAVWRRQVLFKQEDKNILLSIVTRKLNFEKVMVMRHAMCEVCGCSLDFGEGHICEECKEASKKENRIKKEMDRMVHATEFRQIKLEELLK